jgi:hypothetical protein
MKRTKLAQVLTMALLLLAPLAASFSSIANAIVLPLNVISPLSKNVYHSSDVLLSFEITIPESWSEVYPGYSGGVLYYFVGAITSVGYSLDEKVGENVTVDSDSNTIGLTIGPSSKTLDFSFNLTQLSDGPHNVNINVFGGYNGKAFNFSRGPIPFFVDTAPLELTVFSPESKVYNVTDIPLSVTTSEPVSWMSYSLDDGDRITINRNITLANMTYGLHRLTVFASDTLGNLASSETLNFTIAEPPAPFPTIIVIATVSAASVVVVSVGLLVYFKKRKR